ncbi:histidine decarboxylase [Chelmon rostratus]|uniref:histidine decarboxylase n=1 Tax=Chelmon rostratus TaxID=109905 RepID=UPI001BEC2FEA|nr:histidine decarboxylase [Chelmon rostratus]
MQAEEYNRRGKELVDYITRYLSSIRERRVIPDVKPGYMKDLLPDTAPTEPEDWESIFNDIEKVIMPGVVHWQSPHMHAYYPCLTSWPSMLGDMLADAINCVGFTWASSPACTELEIHVLDWLCKALGLPSFFLHHHPDSRGGGILQGTVSESTLVALLAARTDKILQLRAELDQDVEDSVLNSRLVAYASDQAHSSVEKAGLISLVKIRFLPTDEQLSLRGDTLKQAVQEDRMRGLVPFMLCATLGSTGVCAFDNLSEVGPVCAEEGMWLHVDAAYAGSAYVCPELRWSLGGIEFAHSFVFNPAKWMMVHFDCTAFWSRRPMRSLSCNSEPLPYNPTVPASGHDRETRPCLKDAAGALPTPSAGPDPVIQITNVPSNLPGKQDLKKLTKFYSVPSFCKPWVQCGQHQVCCPLKVSQEQQHKNT